MFLLARNEEISQAILWRNDQTLNGVWNVITHSIFNNLADSKDSNKFEYK
ncbi:hypothetical protein VCR17J2_200009 [Vibrio coralliirubri]|nr:hypothetical protein VCR17J2_200009 [Vibrio coralliirubri]